MFKNFLLGTGIILLSFITNVCNGQAFIEEINAFKKADSTDYPFPNQNPIVFTGSSSFRLWKNMKEDFPNYPVINRGFGGATLSDLIRYADDIIIKYLPKQVVIYAGENDLASSENITADTVYKRFKELYYLLRESLPRAEIDFVSIKPSPSRLKIQPEVIRANKMIRRFLGNQDKNKAYYIDVYTAMINEDGTIKKELFIEDNLHMNEKGYAIWQRIIGRELKK
ncbi:MAG: GDSL-type esterase/lipase family protein [Ferruginibacter sp.]